MTLPGYCNCSTPARTVYEGVLTCEACGEPIADPLLLRILAEVLALRRQLTHLERRLTEPRTPAPEWLAAKEFAQRLAAVSISSIATPTSSVPYGSATVRGRAFSSQRIRFLPVISRSIRLRGRRHHAGTGTRRPRPDDEHMTTTQTLAHKRFLSPSEAASGARCLKEHRDAAERPRRRRAVLLALAREIITERRALEDR